MSNRRVNKCSIRGCDDKISPRHRFPVHYPDVMKQWIAIVGDPRFKDMPYRLIHRNHYVCRRHFSDEWFVRGTRRGLKVDAIPTLFIGEKENDSSIQSESVQNTQSIEENETVSQEKTYVLVPQRSITTIPVTMHEPPAEEGEEEENDPTLLSESEYSSVQDTVCSTVGKFNKLPILGEEENDPTLLPESQYSRVQDTVCPIEVTEDHNLPTQPVKSFSNLNSNGRALRLKHIRNEVDKISREHAYAYTICMDDPEYRDPRTLVNNYNGTMQDETIHNDDDESINKTNTSLPDNISSLLRSDKTVCRFCLGTENVSHQIFSETSESTREQDEYRAAILSSVPVKIEKDDCLPQCICESCYNALVSWHNFKEMCVSTNIILRQYISNMFVITNSKQKSVLNNIKNNSSTKNVHKIAVPHSEKTKASNINIVDSTNVINDCEYDLLIPDVLDKENENTAVPATRKQKTHYMVKGFSISENEHSENVLTDFVDGVKISLNKESKRVNKRPRKKNQCGKEHTDDFSSLLEDSTDVSFKLEPSESDETFTILLNEPIEGVPVIYIKEESPLDEELNCEIDNFSCKRLKTGLESNRLITNNILQTVDICNSNENFRT